MVQDGQQIHGVYELLIETLDHLNHNQEKNEVILYAYLIKFLTLLGFMSPWDHCARSGEKLNLMEPLYLSMEHGSVIRSGYNGSLDPRLTPPLIKWVNYMQQSPFADIVKVRPNKGERIQVWTVIQTIFQNILNAPVKAELFLREVV